MTGLHSSEDSTPELLWPQRSVVDPFGDGHIHVWAAALDVSVERQGQLYELLSDGERQRAARFRFEADALRWVAGRGVLREILGAYVGVEPRHLRIAVDVHGKPFLASSAVSRSIGFNLSHAGGVAVYAVSRSPMVGVDIESVKSFPEMIDVASRFFSHAERASLATVPSASHSEAFHCCWTRKEAYVKACGLGLLAPLDRFDVTVDPERPAALLRIDGDATAAEQWSLSHLLPAKGFVGAVAVGSPHCDVRCWTWSRYR